MLKKWRVYSGPLKVSLVVATGFVAFFLGLFLSFATTISDGVLVSVTGLGWVVAIYALTRIFRAEDESAAPRPWWKLTASQPLSWLCCVLFITSGVQRLVQDVPHTPVLGGIYIVFGMLFMVNALKLRQR